MFEQLKNLFGNLSNRSQSDDTNLSDAEIQALQDSGMLDDNIIAATNASMKTRY